VERRRHLIWSNPRHLLTRAAWCAKPVVVGLPSTTRSRVGCRALGTRSSIGCTFEAPGRSRSSRAPADAYTSRVGRSQYMCRSSAARRSCLDLLVVMIVVR
jgi:hypothetical protein